MIGHWGGLYQRLGMMGHWGGVYQGLGKMRHFGFVVSGIRHGRTLGWCILSHCTCLCLYLKHPYVHMHEYIVTFKVSTCIEELYRTIRT